MSKIPKLDQDAFEEKVIKRKELVLIDFFADWCGPCHMIAQTLEEIIKKRPELKIYKVDVEKMQKLTAQYSITSLPTLIFFKNGKPIDQFLGYQDTDSIIKKFENLA